MKYQTCDRSNVKFHSLFYYSSNWRSYEHHSKYDTRYVTPVTDFFPFSEIKACEWDKQGREVTIKYAKREGAWLSRKLQDGAEAMLP